MSKYRKGFVSNSSSSSFVCDVCDVCGGVESGYDASCEDFDMFECENGHVFMVLVRQLVQKNQHLKA